MLWGRKKKRVSMLLSSSCIGKDSEVEVTPEDEGFQGSWYRAVLEENPKKSRRQKLLVRYKTLLDDEDGSGSGSTPLTETVDRRNIRPVPPEELYDAVVLEVGSVVDAYLRDGWWIGSVVKIKEDENNYSVCFDSKDMVRFERTELRAHFDWTGSKWIRPDNTKTSEDNNRKRKREEQNVSSVANNEETKSEDTTIVLPFKKKLPIWETFETIPHFKPLFDTRESYREMYAVGMMHTFAGLMKDVKDLRLDHPISTLRSLDESFAELEKHGFDVKAPQSRVCKLLSLKDRQVKKMEERKEKEKKILELRKHTEEADKEIANMKSCIVAIDQELEDVGIQFQTSVLAPW